MYKPKKLLKWLGIGASSLFALLFIIAIASPTEPVSKSDNKETPTVETATPDTENQIKSEAEQISDVTEVASSNNEETQVSSTAKNNTAKSTDTVKSTGVTYKVERVVDGDTIRVVINGVSTPVRIIGLNTPETVDPRKTVECFGKEASAVAKTLLSGKQVTLEADPTQGDRDKYNRLIRYVFLADGTDYSKRMISDGYAYEYTYNTPYKYQKEYKQAQAEAKSAQRGLWAPNACANFQTSTPTSSTTTTAIPSGKYYLSSASNATKYYPESCSGWKELSPNNLKAFSTLEELLSAYPGRTLAESCK